MGPYRFSKVVGHGATATVYLATREGVDTLFAVKVFHSALWSQPEFRKRAMLELKLVNDLDHPNVLKIREALLDSPHPALVFDFVEGGDLEKFQSRLPYILPELSVLMVCEILEVLEHAHGKGIVHRDLKPSNVLVDEHRARVVVNDFGLAKMRDASQLTLNGTLLGSPDYMSPEQARGEHADASSDIFSVGAILYFLVTGTRPFARNTPLATLAAVSRGEFEAPQNRNPKISDALAGLIRRALASDPADRYASAAEMRDQLRAYLNSIGLDAQRFSLTAWFESSSECVYSAMERAATTLFESARLAIAKKQRVLAVAALKHVSLLAPASTELPKLMQRAQQRSKRIAAGWFAAPLALLALVAVFFTMHRPQPRQNTQNTKNTVAVSAPASQEVPLLATPAVVAEVPVPPVVTPAIDVSAPASENGVNTRKATRVLPRHILGTVRFEIPKDVKVMWNGNLLAAGKRLLRVPVGNHAMKLLKPGSQPIETTIKVNAYEPVVIRAR